MSPRKSPENVAVPPYPPYSDDRLRQPAQYGVLDLLVGTWVNHNPNHEASRWGLHTTCMPSPGTNTETIFGVFHFLCDNYTEELTFTRVEGGVRNRGGTNEQFIGAVKYSQSIQRVSDGVGIHEENGMYLWLNDMYNHPADEASVLGDNGYPEISIGAGANGPNFVPPYSIARSGTIPHGATIQMSGNFLEMQGKPVFPTGTDCWQKPFSTPWPQHQIANTSGLGASPLAISKSMGATERIALPDGYPNAPEPEPLDLDKPAPAWAFDKSLPVQFPDSNVAYFQRIVAHPLYPYSVRPDLRLRDALCGQDVLKHTFIQLTTKHDGGPQGGVLNTPFVQRFANVPEATLNLWLETVMEHGKEVLQLQYEQIMFFEFMFGSSGRTTRWPHIQVNTLRKKPSSEVTAPAAPDRHKDAAQPPGKAGQPKAGRVAAKS